MRQYRLIYKIVGCLLLVSVTIAFSVVKTLYDETIVKAEDYMGDVALATASLIKSVALFDEEANEGADPDAVATEKLSQIKSAIQHLPHREAIGEILFVRYDGKDIEVGVHQKRDRESDHPSKIDSRSSYAKSIIGASSGEVSVTHVDDPFHGEGIILAVVPIPELGGAVVVETSKKQVLAPFVGAAVNGLSVAVLAISFGTFYVYIQSRRATKDMIEAKSAIDTNLAELQRMKSQLDQVIDATPDSLVLFDADDRLVFCNAKYTELCRLHGFDTLRPGVTFEELVRSGLESGIFAEAVGREEEWLSERLAQHGNPTGPVEQQLTDGRWLRVVDRKTADGGTVGFLTDITELKEKESALLDSQQRFKDFSDTASDWAWETDADHRFVFLSAGLEEEDVFSLNDAIGRTRLECSSENTDNEKWQKHLGDLYNHRPFSNFEYSIAGRNGKTKIVSASGKPAYDSTGHFRGYRGTGRDVTVIRSQQENLQKAELRFRRAFESITIGIMLSDDKGVIVQCNPEACRIFGYREEELIGSSVKMLMPESDSVRHDQYIGNYLRTGVGKIIGTGREVVGLRKNGETFPMNLGIAEMTVDGERQFLGSIVDLSKEKALEGQLRQAQKMESVGQLVGGIAHDFNNILGIIVGNLDLVKRKLNQDEKLYRQVDKAVSAANRGASLTRRLLNFARQTPTQSEPIDVNDNIRNIHELLQRSITRSVEIKLFLYDDLPMAVADPGDFQDALVNLAVNARDAMPGGGILRIGTRIVSVGSNAQKELRDIRPGQYVEIDVADTGMGMPEEVKARIFDPFFTTKETGKGTGLGLPMVYGFARRSGGTVTVYSEEGVGTSFKIFLPVAVRQETVGGQPDETVESANLPNGSETVLIVDDEEDLAEIAAAVLEDLGYRVIVVNSGAKAMEILVGDEPIDLMLSDVVMPGGMSGYELADAAEHLRPAMRVCLVSGFTGDLANGAIRPNESYPFLQKPYDNKSLALQVRGLLDSGLGI